MTQSIAIIGAGPAGEAAAKSLRSHVSPQDLTINLIEKEEAGGLCLNKGCIPSKTLLEHVRKRVEFGLSVEWSDIQKAKLSVVSNIRQQLQASFKSQNINLIRGLAHFENEGSLLIQGSDGSHSLSFDKAIITTGTEIFYPPPLDEVKDQLLNSDKLLDIEKTPESIVIIGGGAVGLEFACLLNAAGSKVTVVELQDQILPGEDPNIVKALERSFTSRGMTIITNTKVTDLKKDKQWTVYLGNNTHLQAQEVMACVGRRPNPTLLELSRAKIDLKNNQLLLNKNLQTTNQRVYAAGDATTTRLAHAAAAQAEIAASNALGDSKEYDDRLVPRCLYSWPEVASVGAWKYQLDEMKEPAKTSRAFYRGSGKALASNETEGFVQVVYHPETKQIYGAQIIGSHATELIHVFSVALKAKMTTQDVADVMFAHPTLSEMIKEACRKA